MEHIDHTPAKRTQREIRRMAAMTRLILESAKKLGPGSDRHVPFMQALQRLKEYKTLPSWRRAYVQGYAEGASAVLALIDAGVIAVQIPAPTPAAPEPEPRPAARARVMKRLPDVGSVPPAALPEAPAPKPSPATEYRAPEDAYALLQKLQAVLAALPSPAPDGR